MILSLKLKSFCNRNKRAQRVEDSYQFIKMSLTIKNISFFLYVYRFIGEEETSDGKKSELTNAPTWIIDPVDGTMNFVHR